MIKTWTDSKDVKHYADEHSKAYRDRDEAKPAPKAVEEPKPAPKPVAVKPEGK